MLSIPAELFLLNQYEEIRFSVSEQRNGQLRILGIWDNHSKWCQIIVCKTKKIIIYILHMQMQVDK